MYELNGKLIPHAGYGIEYEKKVASIAITRTDSTQSEQYLPPRCVTYNIFWIGDET